MEATVKNRQELRSGAWDSIAVFQFVPALTRRRSPRRCLLSARFQRGKTLKGLGVENDFIEFYGNKFSRQFKEPGFPVSEKAGGKQEDCGDGKANCGEFEAIGRS